MVERIVKELDPEGVELKKSRKLKKRVYVSRGPNFCWHIDGKDPLFCNVTSQCNCRETSVGSICEINKDCVIFTQIYLLPHSQYLGVVDQMSIYYTENVTV